MRTFVFVFIKYGVMLLQETILQEQVEGLVEEEDDAASIEEEEDDVATGGIVLAQKKTERQRKKEKAEKIKVKRLFTNISGYPQVGSV